MFSIRTEDIITSISCLPMRIFGIWVISYLRTWFVISLTLKLWWAEGYIFDRWRNSKHDISYSISEVKIRIFLYSAYLVSVESMNETTVNLEVWKASRVLARLPDIEGYLPACIKGVRGNKDITVQVCLISEISWSSYIKNWIRYSGEGSRLI